MSYQVKLGYKPPHTRTAVKKKTPFGRIIQTSYDGLKLHSLHATKGRRKSIPIQPSLVPHLWLMAKAA